MRNAIVLFCLFGLAFSGKALAQFKEPDAQPWPDLYRNSVYLEIGGNGGVGSLNYERLFKASGKPGTTFILRIGGIYVPAKGRTGNPEYFMTIPIEGSMFFGKKAIKPEIGFGLTYLESYQGPDRLHDSGYLATGVLPALRLGFRYQKPGTPVLIRFGLTPLMVGFTQDFTADTPIMPWAGISVGYSFGKK